MKAIIGLGNPEVKYKTTRHNTGFLITDEILKSRGVTLSEKFGGTFRLKKEGTFGGHNGIKSIINRLGTSVFDRLKVGVGPVPDNIPIDNFVLGNFSADELMKINKMGKIADELVDIWLREGIEKAQNKYNGQVI